MITIERPQQCNYLVLESLNQKKENCNIKSIHVIKLSEDQKISLGRGHESDVRINDISVSRLHANICFVNNKIRLRDLKSKFGTLALVKRDLQITKKKINLQIGRTLVEAYLNQLKESNANVKK